MLHNPKMRAIIFTQKKAYMFLRSRNINSVKNCSRERYVNRATYLLTVIHIMEPAGMWPLPLPAAPVIKLQCIAGFYNQKF